jgi:tripartite-type tricarboxylate transporter receptor subunit TctC
MSSTIHRRNLLAWATVAACGVTSLAFAQEAYPSRTVQLIHGFGAGGNADVVARLMAQKLQELLKQSVIVDIKSGAGGAIATSFVAKAPPDGYSLVMLTGAHTVSAALRKNLPYDSVKDFAFVSTVSSFPFVVAVRADHPARTLADLIAIAKKDPGKVSFTSVGVGSTQHMVGELLASSAGVKMLHVPYRGGGAPIQAVIGRDVDVLADTLTVATPHIQSGRLRALGVTSAGPWPSLPGVAPVSAVLPGFEVRSWLGIAAPAGTPDAVVRRLSAELRKVLQDPDVKKTFAAAGSAPAPSSPDAMREMIQTDIARWRSVIARSNIRVE